MLSLTKAFPQKSSSARSTEARPLPAWQREKANRLHRKFKTVLAAQARGVSARKSLKHFVWFWRGKTFRTDPKCKVQFTLPTLLRLYRQWQHGGQVPAAVLPRYKSSGPSIPAWPMLRFNQLVHTVVFPHMRAAWNELSRRGAWGGHGTQPAKRRLPVSYGQLCYHYGAARFRKAQTRLKAIADAQRALGESRLQSHADIRRRLPDRPKRKRRTGAELSLEGAQL